MAPSPHVQGEADVAEKVEKVKQQGRMRFMGTIIVLNAGFYGWNLELHPKV